MLRLPPRRSASHPAGLLAQARDDPGAFAAFYEAHAQQVLVYFTRRTMDVQIALDLMSETFAVALEECPKFRGTTPEQERGWLYAIAKSQLTHFLRDGDIDRRALQRLDLSPAQLTDPDIERIETLAGIAELAKRVNGALAGLPPDQQDAIRLRVVDELDYPAVASQLGISEQTARARVSRGLRALTRDLGPQAVAKEAT